MLYDVCVARSAPAFITYHIYAELGRVYISGTAQVNEQSSCSSPNAWRQCGGSRLFGIATGLAESQTAAGKHHLGWTPRVVVGTVE